MSSTRIGVSCWDVMHWWAEVERTHNVGLSIHLHRPIRDTRGKAFTVRISVARGRQGAAGIDVMGVSSDWPNSDSRTFMGLLLLLLVRLDTKLTQERTTAERADTARLPGF